MHKLITAFFCFAFCVPSAKAHPGIGIVRDSQGNVFYTDLIHVWKITPGGNRSIAVKNVHTHELYIDEQDNLYGEHEWYKGEATDKWGNYVWCLSKEGVLERAVPEVEGFLDNNTLVRDAEGNSYWAKRAGEYQLIMRQSPDGQSLEMSSHRFEDIRWLYFSKTDHSLYVVDKLQVKRVSPTGEVTVVANELKEDAPPFGGVADRHYIFGLCTGKHKEVYVAVYGAQKVKKIEAGGAVETVFESAANWSPCGVLQMPEGTLWIMEFSKNNTARVVKVHTDGSQETYE